MSNNLQVFNYEDFNVEVIVLNDEVLFNAKQVGEVLEIVNVRTSLLNLDEDEKVKVTNKMIENSDVRLVNSRKLNNAGETFLTESGLYALSFRSNKESAKRFTKWVSKEVLPQIRKTAQVLEVVEFTGVENGLVYSKEGKPTTKSTLVANAFDRQHRHVLESIDSKVNSDDKTIAEFSAVNFIETSYLSNNGQFYREYEMTEEGFNFIALGFTGDKADNYKIKYITEFSKMKKWIQDIYKARLVESVLPQDNKNRQFVYIIENKDNGAIKIGVATDPERRLKQLQTGSVSELEIVYQSYVCSNAFEIEKNTHNKFENYHIRGEWYDMSKSDVILYLENQRYVLKSEFTKHLSITSQLIKGGL